MSAIASGHGSTRPGPCRIVILAKAPIAGYAKTRLIPALGAEGAAQLGASLLLHTVERALAAAVGPVELCAAPNGHHRAWVCLDLPASLAWSDQGEGDLGARMARASRRTLAGGENVLLIGSDCPALGVEPLRRAAADLESHDASLVPTSDGGYALLGLKRFDASLFLDMPWSTEAVSRLTLARLARIAWTVAMQPPLDDIDTPADLAKLPQSLAPPIRRHRR